MTKTAAGASPVDCHVRPCAWMTWGTLDGKVRLNLGEATTNHAYTLAHKAYRWEPLYSQATLDAAVAAERERQRKLVEQCRDALAEELSAWDIDPPLHHVKEAHDACVAWLLRA